MLLLHTVLAAEPQALTGLIEVDAPAAVTVGTDPTLTVRVPGVGAFMLADCSLLGADHRQTHVTPLLAPGEPLTLTLPSAPPVSAVACVLVARLASGRTERREDTFSWTWVEPAPEQ